MTDLGLDHLSELASEIEKTGVRCLPRAVDAASPDDVKAVIEEALRDFGRLDVFVANAGIATGTRLLEEDEKTFMHMMRINALR